MNIIFGSASKTGTAGVIDSFSRTVSDMFGASISNILTENEGPFFNLATLSDGGVIIGHAANPDAVLIYIGAIHLLNDSWSNEQSPIDYPNATADVLLERYLSVGKNFLSDIVGPYAIAIVDQRSQSVILAADPSGGRSWFVSDRDGELTFSSHLYSLAQCLEPAAQIDRSLEDFFLIYGFYPYGRTPYQGIRSLSPGEILEWNEDGLHSSRIVPSPPWKNGDTLQVSNQNSETEVVEHLYQAMVRATQEQLPSGKQKVGVLLGGFDSALVASIIKRIGHDVVTYSFYYDQAEFNQPHTDTLAKHLGIEHKWIPITRDIVEKGIQEFPKYFNQPTNWPNYVLQTAHLCKIMRLEGINHVYSGDGCDAVFLGYPGTYMRARIFAAMPALATWLHRGLMAIAARPSLDKVLGHPYRVALNILRSLGQKMPARGYLSFRIMDEISLEQLRRNKAPAAEKPLSQLVEDLSEPHRELPALRLAYQGKAAVSPNRNKLIGSSDYSGLTILSPYLHPGLKKFAVSLPEELMRPEEKTKAKATGKYILMKMAEEKGLLPSSIIYQPKVAAVDGPIDEWYEGPMRNMLLEIMHGLPFDYDEKYANHLLDQKWSEKLFKRYVMTDKVISHAASLLATYATFTSLGNNSQHSNT